MKANLPPIEPESLSDSRTLLGSNQGFPPIIKRYQAHEKAIICLIFMKKSKFSPRRG